MSVDELAANLACSDVRSLHEARVERFSKRSGIMHHARCAVDDRARDDGFSVVGRISAQRA